jgi:endonuclease/exonuclease/phosphatase family metal-dependent hydrolase
MSWRLRVASYNVRKAVGLDWRRRPERILAVLDEIGPDVAVLQEADKRLGPRPSAIPHALLAGHGRLGHLDPGPGPSLGWHGNAVLLRAGITGEVAERMALPGLEPRGALLLRISEGRHGLLLGALHLGLTRGARRRQVTAILEAAGREPLPFLLAGDLNEPRPARLLPEGAPVEVVTPGPSFHAARPFTALDHLLHGPGVRVRDRGVHHSPLARTASDHLPIWADIEVG